MENKRKADFGKLTFKKRKKRTRTRALLGSNLISVHKHTPLILVPQVACSHVQHLTRATVYSAGLHNPPTRGPAQPACPHLPPSSCATFFLQPSSFVQLRAEPTPPRPRPPTSHLI